MVDKVIKVPLNQNQKDALIMFAYNVGESNLKLMANQPGRLNDGNYGDTPKYMRLYASAGGNKNVAGLVRRRGFESNLFEGDLTSAKSFTGVAGFDKYRPY
tara:strand:- start:521 stop:823 length:303 start_codon:yes stop_codon:yes gene_type:complete